VNGFCCANSRRLQRHKRIVESGKNYWKELKGGTHHANRSENCATLGVVGAIAVGNAAPAAAWYGYHHRYYHHHAYYPYHHRHYYAYYPYYHHHYRHHYWHHWY
jgi:hypothetical protein